MSDEMQRARALDLGASFLVQAPAGSGKTALLTQRVLRLLATVEQPEEILAITFTRKAAAEMRGRILESLRAAENPRPEDPFAAATWELAARALERDREQGWRLLESPGRLRMQTIDSFQQSLVQRLPWLSKAGVSVAPTESAQPYYADAVREALRFLAADSGEGNADRRALIDLLLYRDNHLEQLSGFLADLLAKRDQWLGLFGADLLREEDSQQLRAVLEGNLRSEVERQLAEARAALPDGADVPLAPLARYAAENIRDQNLATDALLNFQTWPGASAEELPIWRGLRAFLVTGKVGEKGELRKPGGLNVRSGFPKDDEGQKNAMKRWLMEAEGNTELVNALLSAASLPEPSYSDEQWRTLEALFRLMRVLAPMLHVQFAMRGETDFTEIALRAAMALEEIPGSPTVLAERLDAQIQHLLVDEFQDTSILQMQIVKALTSSWTPGDGRTLFLVGDPMQSIYGWRNARVDLFLRAWAGTLGGLPALETLRLKRNFRSRPRLISECNEAFRKVLPEQNDASTGRVALAPAVPGREAEDLVESRIQCEAFLAEDRDPRYEAEWLADEITRLQAITPSPRIGVLFRKKGQGATVAKALGERNIPYQAVDLESLAALPVIMDLRSLLGALLSTANRLSWWSVLRAPWNGLRLATLDKLQRLSEGRTVWHAVERACEIGEDAFGDADEVLRLRRTRRVFLEAFAWRGRRHVADVLRAVFLNSGASVAHGDARSQLAAQQFFRLLLDNDEAVLMSDPSGLDESLERLFAPSDPKAPDTLQLLTIHKAKGLEFDYVFLPYLNSKPANRKGVALAWDEALDGNGEGSAGSALLLAPGKAPGEAEPSLAGFIQRRWSAREKEEGKRVLYVAMTRAKERLYLSATIDPSKAASVADLRPMSASYLQEVPLWERFLPLFEARWRELLQRREAGEVADAAAPQRARYPLLRRVRALELPEIPAVPLEVPAIGAAGEAKLYRPGGSWETVETAQGTVFHRVMEMVAGGAALNRAAAGGDALQRLVLDALRGLLPAEEDLDDAAGQVMEGIRRTADSETGRWIFSDTHRQVFREQSLAYTEGNVIREARLDRVIEDAEGQWHVVDFKLVDTHPEDLDAFVAEQHGRYRSAMERYGQLWQTEYPGSVRLMLFFPLQNAAAQWTLEPAVRRAGG